MPETAVGTRPRPRRASRTAKPMHSKHWCRRELLSLSGSTTSSPGTSTLSGTTARQPSLDKLPRNLRECVIEPAFADEPLRPDRPTRSTSASLPPLFFGNLSFLRVIRHVSRGPTWVGFGCRLGLTDPGAPVSPGPIRLLLITSLCLRQKQLASS